MKYLPDFSKLSDQEVKKLLKDNNIGLQVQEARQVQKVLGRTPTLTEATLWGIQGSEHCSYKSSRKFLKELPVKAPNVILGPGEDSGIVELANIDGERYGIVVSHESHNHPSQIVPYEGAATGVGGCVRDVICMGAKVIGVMDPLRFGDVRHNEQRQIAETVVEGIGGYGNPVGVPNLGGDAYFEPGFNENCLVNVVAFGLIKESQIIHSFVQPEAADEKWQIIIVGKPTDMSGMGGAAFASGTLEESEKEKNKGAVQEPNPFLKRHLMVSTYDLFEILKKKGILNKVSFKDMGAGGITCSTVEQVAKQNLGASIDLGKVNVAIDDLPPQVIGCAETQERFTWMCHPDLTQMILDHYNNKWDLPSVADNAGAFLIGEVTKGNYILNYRGEEYVNACSRDITESLQYDREYGRSQKNLKEPEIPEPENYNETMLQLLAAENIACKKPFYEKYDKQVQGFTVIEAGEADASVIAPLIDEKIPARFKKTGAAFSTDGNPRYAMIDPYHGAINAVVESMRNVAAVGAQPQAITNCLNYGNPEKEDQMWELKEGVRGIADACKGVHLKNHSKFPTPVISGNVSLYNESKKGHIPPSAIICCIGKIDDYDNAVTMRFKKADSSIYLIGERKNELGGSEYYRLHGKLGKNVPVTDLAKAAKEIYTVIDAIDAKTVAAAHDISEGGLAVALCEMCFGGRGDGRIGVDVDISSAGNNLRPDTLLFSETGGFLVEVPIEKQQQFEKISAQYGLSPVNLGKTTKSEKIVIRVKKNKIMELPVAEAAQKWLNGVRTLF